MKFYCYTAIKAATDCEKMAAELGLKVVDHRCAATWRGGENANSVHIEGAKWSDHGNCGKGGSVIDLVAEVRFGGNMLQAQEWLGERLGLEPLREAKKNPVSIAGTHYEKLLQEGYAEVSRYDYTDERGKLSFQVIRLQHPEKGKEFLQQAANGRWSVKDCPKVLYNLPTIADYDWVCVVEGEKDVETLKAWGIPATCNPGGAGKWLPEYTAALNGKDVIILRDNDEAGENHATIVASALAGHVKNIRIVNISALPKGDVTDWRDKEGGTEARLMDVLKAAKPIDQGRVSASCTVASAKQANLEPFRNYTVSWEKGKNVPEKAPRHVREMVRDVKTRFLGFPRKIGESLFDHDRDTGRIVYIDMPPQFYAWMQDKSGQGLEWAGGHGMVPKDEFFAAIRASAQRYEAVSTVPDWPMRQDVYYSHPKMPPPSAGFEYLEKLVNFFCPATPEDKCLLRTLICAPIYFEMGIMRPVWILESEIPGAGKTTLAFILAEIYCHAPIEVKVADFRRDVQEITKRCVSPEGRQARILLVDNVVGTFACGELSSMITAQWITGRPSYGRNEESRPNNLTYVLTANNASVDNDLAIRSYTVKLKALTSYNDSWNRNLRRFIADHRLNILADIQGLLETHKPFADVKPATRFPEFEISIMQPCCGNVEMYCSVVKNLLTARADANIEGEWGNAVEDAFRHQLSELQIHPDHETVFVRSSVAERWIREAIPDMRFQNAMQTARNMARAGHCPRIHPEVRIWPHRGEDRRRGVLWMDKEENRNPIKVVLDDGGKPRVKPVLGGSDALPGATEEKGF